MKQTIKILNLYACLGGNRYKWDEVAEKADVSLDITAIELDEELAKLYQKRFLGDKVIVADAHEYLRNNFKNFDFIWSSPPCPSHSKIRISQQNREGFEFIYPEMSLYQEIIFLQNFFKGSYVIENVNPYYTPLIPAQKRGRHLFWSDLKLPYDLNERKSPLIEKGSINELSKFHDFDFTKYKGKQRRNKIARNLVDYEVGRTILEVFLNVYQEKKRERIKDQILLF
jgi:DNA (cytosine-5)-methyltransferase 1